MKLEAKAVRSEKIKNLKPYWSIKAPKSVVLESQKISKSK